MKEEKHFDEWSQNYNNYLFISPHHDNWVQNKLINGLNLNNKPSILDLGTGNGRLLLAIAKRNPKCQFIGLDFSQGMLNQAKTNFKRLNLKGKFIKSSMEKIPLKKQSLDYVVSSTAIHHIKNKKKLFSEIYQVLKNNGKLAVIDQFDRTDAKYRILQNKLKKKNPEFWKRYIKSFEKAEWQTAREFNRMKTEHPKEYHITPFTIKKLLEQTGFRNVKIIPTPKFFGIYTAEKEEQ